MRPSTPWILAQALVFVSAASAGSWLSGPSAYQQAVDALAASRWDEAERLILAADPSEGRAPWVGRLLQERRDAAFDSGYETYLVDRREASLEAGEAVAHSFAYHNLYLFVRAEGQPESLQADGLAAALATYEFWLARVAVPSESLRWGYAGLLHEADRGTDADAFLLRTQATSDWKFGVEGPPSTAAKLFQPGFQMLLAYFHAARGASDSAVAYLLAARDHDPKEVDLWVTQSDDFWLLRQTPQFGATLPHLALPLTSR